jgi:hypothetical protein
LTCSPAEVQVVAECFALTAVREFFACLLGSLEVVALLTRRRLGP